MHDHEKAESYLLRANKADIIVKYYKETGMWQDALRIAKEYMPDMLPQLQVSFEGCLKLEPKLGRTEGVRRRAAEIRSQGRAVVHAPGAAVGAARRVPASH